MSRSLAVYLLLAFLGSCALAENPFSDPDFHRNVTELITSKGYPCETHYVTTTDGYLLSLQRIPPTTANAPVVFLQHGLLDSASTWVINFPEQSLGFILHDAGYDVWLGNSRGNTYSLNPAPLPSDYWEFSWDQMALFDLPASIQYALTYTGAPSLGYVGHSEGTIIGFAAFSTLLSSSVNVFVALAPVTTVGHVTAGLLQDAAKIPDSIFFDTLPNPLLPSSAEIEDILGFTCGDDPNLCSEVACYFAGCFGNATFSDVNTTRYPVYFSHFPAGTSVQNLVHWAQGVRTNLFSSYNYDSAAANEAHYGQPNPPLYNAADIQVPVAVYSGALDGLADPTDVDALMAKLNPTGKVVTWEVFPEYGHGDFVWGLTAHELLYPKVIDVLAKYSSSAAVPLNAV